MPENKKVASLLVIRKTSFWLGIWLLNDICFTFYLHVFHILMLSILAILVILADRYIIRLYFTRERELKKHSLDGWIWIAGLPTGQHEQLSSVLLQANCICTCSFFYFLFYSEDLLYRMSFDARHGRTDGQKGGTHVNQAFCWRNIHKIDGRQPAKW
jgi:hypothetical protein